MSISPNTVSFDCSSASMNGFAHSMEHFACLSINCPSSTASFRSRSGTSSIIGTHTASAYRRCTWRGRIWMGLSSSSVICWWRTKIMGRCRMWTVSISSAPPIFIYRRAFSRVARVLCANCVSVGGMLTEFSRPCRGASSNYEHCEFFGAQND